MTDQNKYLYQKPPYPYAASIQNASFKTVPADFCVTENLGFELSGSGEHLCLYIEKIGLNTGFVAKKLSQWAGIPERDVGFCGLKDRQAITRQWFSLRLPKGEPPADSFLLENMRIIKSQWHSKKLPKGAHKSNSFEILLRHVVGEQSIIEAQLMLIKAQGVPNYFGAQRFGRAGDNVASALEMFAGKRVKRQLRGMLLSAARSYIFNIILAERVANDTWHMPLLGDVFNLDGTSSIFVAEQVDDAIMSRTAKHDIHPTGALWGCGTLKTFGQVAELERGIAQQFLELCKGLEAARLKQERRALRLVPQDLHWFSLEDNALKLTFSLPKGAYATSVIDALVYRYSHMA